MVIDIDHSTIEVHDQVMKFEESIGAVIRRDEVSDLLGLKGIADIENAQPGHEVSQVDDV